MDEISDSKRWMKYFDIKTKIKPIVLKYSVPKAIPKRILAKNCHKKIPRNSKYKYHSISRIKLHNYFILNVKRRMKENL